MAGPSVPYPAEGYPPAPDAAPTLPDGMPNVLAGGRMPQRTDEAIAAAKTRQDVMRLAWRAFSGELPEPLKAQQDGVNDNVQPNRCAAIVNADVDFLAGLPVSVEVQPAKQAATALGTLSERAKAGESPEQDYAEACWGDEDERMTLIAEAVQNGSIFGHTFAKIRSPQDTGTDTCRLLLLDPRTVEVVTDPDNHQVVQAYLITYPGFDARGQPVARRQVIARVDPDHRAALDGDAAESGDQDSHWTISQFTRSAAAATANAQDSGWTPEGTPQVWDYPFPPIVECANLPNANEYWGMPSLTRDIIRLNASVQRTESQIQRAIKLFADPKMWATGVRASQIDLTPGNIIGLHNDQAQLHVLETHADISAMRAFADDLRADMDEQSGTPGIALGRMREVPRGLSGISMRVLYQPRVMKTLKQRRLYGAFIREATARMLVVGGLIDAVEDVRVLLHWQDPLPSDDLAEAQSAEIWEGLGVSQSTLMQRAGFQPDVEQDKKADEAAKQLRAFAKGQGMPPAPGQIPGQIPGQSDMAPGAGPPVNHPAAVAARGAMQQAMAGG